MQPLDDREEVAVREATEQAPEVDPPDHDDLTGYLASVADEIGLPTDDDDDLPKDL